MPQEPPKRKFLDIDHPMLRPLWVRVLILVIAFGWAAVEFVTGSPLWALVFLGFACYAVWGFFLDPNRHPGS